MSSIAAATGGRALVNSPGLSEQLDEVSEELGSYYSLAFEPDHVGDGKYHRVEIKVRREGVRLRHREGYFDTPRGDWIVDRTVAGAMLGVSDNTLGISIQNHGVTRNESGDLIVSLMVEVPIGALILLPSADEHRGQISLVVSVRGADGSLSPPSRRGYPVRVPNELLNEALGKSAGFELRLAMRAGHHRIAVGLRDEVARLDSVSTLEVDVRASEASQKNSS